MKKRKLFYSLKFRIFLLLIIFGILPQILLRAGLIEACKSHAIHEKSAEVLSQGKMLATQIAANDYLQDSVNPALTAQISLLSGVYGGRVILMNNRFQVIKDSYALDEGKSILSEQVIKSYRGEDISHYDAKNHYIKITLPIRDSRTQDVLGVMLISLSTESLLLGYEYLGNIALAIELTFAILVIALGAVFAILLTKPFSKLATSIEEIQIGESEMAVMDYTETEVVSTAFNALLKRLQLIEESRQEFVSNVSHELKTPLTSMKVLADSLIDQENIPAEMYQEFMVDISAEIERENSIINDLLSLVKMDKTASALNIASANINDLLEFILKRLRPIAGKKNIELALETFRPVIAEIDEVKLSLALTNLVENAIKYNKDDGWVHVSLNADHKYFFIRVEDSGIGIPQEDLDHVFERFFRVDKSHSREIGGTGLGLAITRNAILMHRGAIKTHSKLGEGTIFSVRIPLTYVSP
ncbi:hypothetical protein FACS1894111_09430 [Clostridia bacterium]|nr:hypothetical protein FACS1894111_09430 [Clostridia bacterium]